MSWKQVPPKIKQVKHRKLAMDYTVGDRSRPVEFITNAAEIAQVIGWITTS